MSKKIFLLCDSIRFDTYNNSYSQNIFKSLSALLSLFWISFIILHVIFAWIYSHFQQRYKTKMTQTKNKKKRMTMGMGLSCCAKVIAWTTIDIHKKNNNKKARHSNCFGFFLDRQIQTIGWRECSLLHENNQFIYLKVWAWSTAHWIHIE